MKDQESLEEISNIYNKTVKELHQVKKNNQNYKDKKEKFIEDTKKIIFEDKGYNVKEYAFRSIILESAIKEYDKKIDKVIDPEIQGYKDFYYSQNFSENKTEELESFLSEKLNSEPDDNIKDYITKQLNFFQNHKSFERGVKSNTKSASMLSDEDKKIIGQQVQFFDDVLEKMRANYELTNIWLINKNYKNGWEDMKTEVIDKLMEFTNNHFPITDNNIENVKTNFKNFLQDISKDFNKALTTLKGAYKDGYYEAKKNSLQESDINIDDLFKDYNKKKAKPKQLSHPKNGLMQRIRDFVKPIQIFFEKLGNYFSSKGFRTNEQIEYTKYIDIGSGDRNIHITLQDVNKDLIKILENNTTFQDNRTQFINSLQNYNKLSEDTFNSIKELINEKYTDAISKELAKDKNSPFYAINDDKYLFHLENLYKNFCKEKGEWVNYTKALQE